MKLHAIIVLAGVFLSPSTLVSGNPQYGQPIIARGSNAYGAGVGFNDDSLVPLNQPIFDARQQQQGLPRARQVESRPSPVAGLAPQSGPRPLSDLAPSDQPSLGNRQPDGRRPAIGLDEVDLRITDFTTGGQEPPVGTNSLGSGPSVANSPPQPQVIGSAGQPLQGRGPGLNNILTSLPPPTSNDGGVIGVGAVGGNPEVVLGFERNSAQVGGEADGIPLSPGSGSSLQQQPLVARGGNTYGAGRGIEVPTSAPVPEVGGDLNIQPEQPQTREGILSQPALPDDDEVPTEPRAGNAFVAPGPRPIGNNEVSTDRAISQQPARPRTAAPVTPERPNDGEGHHMGGIEWLPESIPGQPLIDYPVLVRLPESGFDCANQDVDGFYADTSEEARCQAFWVCHNKQQDGFLCPNGTLFNQRYFTCDWWFNVRCEESPDYYELNRNIGVVGTRIDTLPAGVVAAASRVHPVFTLLSEILHFPRVPPVLPHNKTQPSSKPNATPQHQTSIEITEKVQERPISNARANSMQSRNADANMQWSPGVQHRKQRNLYSGSKRLALDERYLVGERLGGMRSQRHLTKDKHFADPLAMSLPETPGAPQSQDRPSSMQQDIQHSVNSTPARTNPLPSEPETVIETVEKIRFPTASNLSNTQKLEEDIRIVEKAGNETSPPRTNFRGGFQTALPSANQIPSAIQITMPMGNSPRSGNPPLMPTTQPSPLSHQGHSEPAKFNERPPAASPSPQMYQGRTLPARTQGQPPEQYLNGQPSGLSSSQGQPPGQQRHNSQPPSAGLPPGVSPQDHAQPAQTQGHAPTFPMPYPPPKPSLWSPTVPSQGQALHQPQVELNQPPPQGKPSGTPAEHQAYPGGNTAATQQAMASTQRPNYLGQPSGSLSPEMITEKRPVPPQDQPPPSPLQSQASKSPLELSRPSQAPIQTSVVQDAFRLNASVHASTPSPSINYRVSSVNKQFVTSLSPAYAHAVGGNVSVGSQSSSSNFLPPGSNAAANKSTGPVHSPLGTQQNVQNSGYAKSQKPGGGAVTAENGQADNDNHSGPIQEDSHFPPGSAPTPASKQGANFGSLAPNTPQDSKEGIVIDEDVKVDEGSSSGPVEEDVHFPPGPGTNNESIPGSVSTNAASNSLGPNAGGVVIDEDIKVVSGDSLPPEPATSQEAGGDVITAENGKVDSSNSSGTTQDDSHFTPGPVPTPASKQGANFGSLAPNSPQDNKEGIIIDEDVKVDDGSPSGPVEEDLHFPQGPGTNNGSIPGSVSANTASNSLGPNAGDVVIDEDVKVENGDSSPPEEEKLHFPPEPNPPQAGSNNPNSSISSPNIRDACAHAQSSLNSHTGSGSTDDVHSSPCDPARRSTDHPEVVRDPSALRKDMPSEKDPPDGTLRKMDSAAGENVTQSGKQIQITSESVSKFIAKPSRRGSGIRDPSGLQPSSAKGKKLEDNRSSLRRNAMSKHAQKASEGRQKIVTSRGASEKSSSLVSDVQISQEVDDADSHDQSSLDAGEDSADQSYPEVRITGSVEPLSKSDFASKLAGTMHAVDETLGQTSRASEHDLTLPTQNFDSSMSHIDKKYDTNSGNSLHKPLGINLKVFINQPPMNTSAHEKGISVTSHADEQAPLSAKKRRKITSLRSVDSVMDVAAEQLANDGYDYDFAQLPSWMQRASKRGVESLPSVAYSDQAAPEELSVIQRRPHIPHNPLRSVRKVSYVHHPNPKDTKRGLAVPRVQKMFQSARANLMQILGGPKDTLDSEIDGLLDEAPADKDKRNNDMRLRLDSSSLTSYPDQDSSFL